MNNSFSEFVNEDDEQGMLFEMANLIPSETGLDYIVWVSVRSNREKHGPRVKVKVNNVWLPVTVNDDPRVAINTNLRIPEFKKLQDWIVINKQVLLDYWNSEGNMGIKELSNRIIMVE